MRDQYSKYFITKEKEKLLWDNCVFVFDSSSLLNFYEYSEQTVMIFEKIFERAKGCLWIPNHVAFELDKNKGKGFQNAKSRYINLNSHLKSIKNHFDELKKRTKKSDKHPYLDPQIFDALDSEIQKFEKDLDKQVQLQIEKLNQQSKEDIIYNSIYRNFIIGEEFSFDEILEIIEHGKFRYDNQIPPGYKDFSNSKKIGFQKYGDLILWLQIIKFSVQNKKNIIFINDDLKEDWWVDSSSNKMFIPREELIKEFADKSGQLFWMYNSGEFLKMASDYFSIPSTGEVFNEVDNLIINSVEKTNWKDLIQRNDIIKIDHLSHVLCKHPKLKYVTSLSWDHEKHTLTISEITNPKILFQDKEVLDLTTFNYIILNFNDDGYQRLLKICVNELTGKLSLENILSPELNNLDFIIIGDERD
ncbi:PIN-like domain-containing protein [Lunatimonas salinarum]|uniref:PIN-like domain-containing protein n=1 Tax=Lunatimonas salinarum TaxID=1774590 RepID=UPI001ADF4B4D|nr:PIN-like domain-containing protein [Lunatimonas salinarum]